MSSISMCLFPHYFHHGHTHLTFQKSTKVYGSWSGSTWNHFQLQSIAPFISLSKQLQPGQRLGLGLELRCPPVDCERFMLLQINHPEGCALLVGMEKEACERLQIGVVAVFASGMFSSCRFFAFLMQQHQEPDMVNRWTLQYSVVTNQEDRECTEMTLMWVKSMEYINT